MNQFHKLGALLFAIGLCGAPALAITIAPGGSATISGTSAAARPALNGTVIAQSDTSVPALYFGYPQFTFDLRSTVVQEAGSGTLDFYYQVINNNGVDIQALGNASVSGFAGFATDADFRSDQTGSIAPNVASRDAAGDVLTFGGFPLALNTFIPANGATVPLLVKTNAVSFRQDGVISLNFVDEQGNAGAPPRSASATLNSYVPADASGPVPEPGSVGLFALALAALIGRLTLPRRITHS